MKWSSGKVEIAESSKIGLGKFAQKRPQRPQTVMHAIHPKHQACRLFSQNLGMPLATSVLKGRVVIESPIPSSDAQWSSNKNQVLVCALQLIWTDRSTGSEFNETKEWR
jgi:hypothetical protein